MPTYDYLCTTCDLRFEAHQSFSDDTFTVCSQAPVTCPKAGDGVLRKVYGNVGLTFKGSGFYKTDNRSGGDSTSSTSSSSGSSGSSSPSTASESSSAPAPAAAASSGDGGHGHSHGAGTHTH
jgi:putative FmdB family regulatory protein